jgi:galactokinase
MATLNKQDEPLWQASGSWEELENLTAFRQIFEQLYGAGAPPRFFYAPGRVNLIGEHTDYNDGFVLPIAIDRGTMLVGRIRPDNVLRVHSLNRDETVVLNRSEPWHDDNLGDWRHYVEGMARVLHDEGYGLMGADLLIGSNVPVGSGLSSSAALENAVGFGLLALAGYPKIDRERLARAGQKAEHQYVGTQCGIMDQLATGLGQAGHALLIDCQSLAVTPIPIHWDDHILLLCDSGVKHALASSAYNQRRQECQQAVRLLQAVVPDLTSLRDLSLSAWEHFEAHLEDERLRRRVRHVVTENARTLDAARALQQGDTEKMGELMLASHASLRNDYEVSCKELDFLVDMASRMAGVAGVRMTGGGFGGCTVNLVHHDAVGSFMAEMRRAYQLAFQRELAFHEVHPSLGVHEICA